MKTYLPAASANDPAETAKEPTMTDHTPTPLRDKDHVTSVSAAPADTEVTTARSKRKWPWIVGGIAAVAAGAALLVPTLNDGTASDADTPLVVASTAEVVVTDLTEYGTLSGTLWRSADDPVSSNIGGTVTGIADIGDVVAEGDMLFTVADEPVLLLYGGTPIYRNITLNDDLSITSDLSGTVTDLPAIGDKIEYGDALFEIDQDPVTLFEGATPAYRDIGLAEAAVDLDTGLAGNVTWLPDVGDVIEQGDVLYEIDGQPVVLFYGDREATRTLDDSLVGDDVLQLEEALLSLDYATEEDLTLEGQYSSELAEIVAEWQNDVGMEVDGVVNVGEVVFLPGPVTVEDLNAEIDDIIVSGGTVLSGTVATPMTGDDVLQLEQALVDLEYVSEDDLEVDRTFTLETAEAVAVWQDEIGVEDSGVVKLGEVVFSDTLLEVVAVNAKTREPVPTTPILTVRGPDGMTGTDVLQLEQSLTTLGFDADDTMIADGMMTSETVTAIVAWQTATGQNVDGIVNTGDIVFREGEIRVSGHMTTLGSSVAPGGPVLQVTGNEVLVAVDLPAEDQDSLSVDDAVIITLPDGTTTTGTVTEVSTVATTTPDGTAVFEVTVTLDNPAIAGDLDEAPVEVEVVSDTVTDVVAVPVTALLALQEGGHAVEVQAADGSTSLVAVDPGFYADGLVEVDGGLEPGMLVVVP